MSLLPSEITRATFRRTFRGYDAAEVAAYLTMLRSQVQELVDRNVSLERRCADLDTQLAACRSVEQALQQTVLQAQDSSARAVETARREAQLIIQEAELKAAQIVKKAQTDLTAVKERLAILRSKRDTLVARLTMLLQSELDLIRALEVDDDPDAEPGGEPDSLMAKARAEIEEIVKSLEIHPSA
jgi:cell division initiation protein